MQTFHRTREPSFLVTARESADHFVAHLPEDGVPYWDFTAPITAASPPDISAAKVAGYSVLLLYKLLKGSLEVTFIYLRR
jgi:hypothetical protein